MLFFPALAHLSPLSDLRLEDPNPERRHSVPLVVFLQPLWRRSRERQAFPEAPERTTFQNHRGCERCVMLLAGRLSCGGKGESQSAPVHLTCRRTCRSMCRFYSHRLGIEAAGTKRPGMSYLTKRKSWPVSCRQAKHPEKHKHWLVTFRPRRHIGSARATFRITPHVLSCHRLDTPCLIIMVFQQCVSCR